MTNEQKQFFDNLDSYMCVFEKYLKKNMFEHIHDFCLKIKKNHENNDDPLHDIELNDLNIFKSSIITSLNSVRVQDSIFNIQFESNFSSYIDDENSIFDFMLKIPRISDNKIGFSNKLSEIIDVLSKKIYSDPNSYLFKFNEKAIDEYLDKKNIIFNNLDTHDKDFLNVPYLYLRMISQNEMNFNKQIKNIIKDKLFNLLIGINVNIPNDDIYLSSELITAINTLDAFDEKNKNICFELIKLINLEYHSSFIESKIFKDGIYNGDFDFFNKMFELFPETYNFRIKLATLSTGLNNVDMFDYFLDKEYMVSLKKVRENHIIKISDIKKVFPWLNKYFYKDMNEYQYMLFNINNSDKKDLFFKKLLTKNYYIPNPLPLNDLIETIDDNDEFNLDAYLSFIQPLLTKEMVESSIEDLDKLKFNADDDLKTIMIDLKKEFY